MNKTIFLSISFLFIIFCSIASAHQDKIIELKNGELIGLPEKYQPAYLNLQTKTLQIGENKITFPSCVAKYFPKDNQYDLEITSSWYHDLSAMPAYMVLNIHPENQHHRYQLLFNLETLEPIEFQLTIQESAKFTQLHRLKISAICMEDIEKSFFEHKEK